MTTNKLLVDVNIFEDVIRKRKGWEDSQKILNLVDSGEIEGWISSLTRVIIYFLSVRRIGERKAREIVSDVTHGFSEIPLRSGIGELALKSQMPEYEDNIQLESALQFHLSAVITRNKKHYQQSSIPVFSPDEFLTLLEKKSDSDLLSIPFLDLKALIKMPNPVLSIKGTFVRSTSSCFFPSSMSPCSRSFSCGAQLTSISPDSSMTVTVPS